MNILGVDYGTKNIGLAWTQAGIDVVLPFGTVKNQSSAVTELIMLIKKEEIDKIVVGLPIGLEGKENKNTARVRSFIGRLRGHVNVPIELVNESFSSHEADRLEGGVSRDEKAAMIILQNYINKKNNIR